MTDAATITEPTMSAPDTTQVSEGLLPDSRQVLNLADLDGRSRAARRAKQLVAAFTAALGGNVAPHMRVAIQRAAEMTAIAEQVRALHIAGQCTVDDVVRADGAASRAVKALRLPIGKPKPASIAEQLAALGYRPPSAPPSPAVPEQRTDDERASEAANAHGEATP